MPTKGRDKARRSSSSSSDANPPLPIPLATVEEYAPCFAALIVDLNSASMRPAGAIQRKGMVKILANVQTACAAPAQSGYTVDKAHHSYNFFARRVAVMTQHGVLAVTEEAMYVAAIALSSSMQT